MYPRHKKKKKSNFTTALHPDPPAYWRVLAATPVRVVPVCWFATPAPGLSLSQILFEVVKESLLNPRVGLSTVNAGLILTVAA